MVSAKWEGLRKPWLSSCDLLIENSVKGLAQNGLGGGGTSILIMVSYGVKAGIFPHI